MAGKKMLSLDNVTDELLATFALHATLFVFNHVIVSFMTGQTRLKTKSFANPEDAKRHGNPDYCRENVDVERLRRIHRNDLENIPAFLLTSFLYALTAPSVVTYSWWLRIYTMTRAIYSWAYLYAWPAPLRSLVYAVGLYLVHVPMLLLLLWKCCKA